jgi:hypothetical protein
VRYNHLKTSLFWLGFFSLPSILSAQDVFGSIHIGLAEVNDSRHPMLGASISLGATSLQELRARIDTNVSDSFKIGSGNGKTDTKITAISTDWIFHKEGVHKGRLLFGAGIGLNFINWTETVYEQGDWRRPVRAHQSSSTPDLHLIVGFGLGSHFRFESRANILGSTFMSSTSNSGKYLILLTTTWSF